MRNEPTNTRPEGRPDCELCATPGGQLVWRDGEWRLVRVEDAPGFPGFYRLVHDRHVAEFSQLPAAARQRCTDLLAWVEGLVIGHLRPTKVNLASFGNMVPHLHWHVVARFEWDSHFPSPLWAPAQRPAPVDRLRELSGLLPALDAALAAGPPAR